MVKGESKKKALLAIKGFGKKGKRQGKKLEKEKAIKKKEKKGKKIEFKKNRKKGKRKNK